MNNKDFIEQNYLKGGVKMSEDKKAEMIREFVKAFESNDFEKAASLCSYL